MFIRKDENRIKKLEDIKTHRVAIVKGYATVKGYAPYLDNAQIIEVDSLKDAIYAVLNNKADLLLDSQLVVEYIMNKNLITGLKALFIPSNNSESRLHMLVRNDKPLLHSIIQKLLNSISYEEEQEILNKWIFSKHLDLTKQEEKWLSNKGNLSYVIDPFREPFEYINDLNKHSGITADILNLISKKSNITFSYTPTSNWEESVKTIENNQANMHTLVIENNKRKGYLDFIDKTLFKVPIVFISKNNDKTIYENIAQDCATKKIGVVKSRAIIKKLKKRYPTLNLVPVKTVEDGIKKLKNNEIDLFALNITTAKYYINLKEYDGIKVATKLDIFFEFKIALQNTLPPEALSIINKVLNDLSPRELNSIYDKYTSIQVHTKIDWKLLSQIIGGMFIVLLVIIYWNRTMAKEIAKRKEAENSLSQALDNLKETNKLISDSIEYASLIQHALIPEKKLLDNTFEDYFTLWKPKDVVGGDIYLFEQINEDESILMVIDCTGHGVPGAFVTMLVKAIERQIVSTILNNNEEISPAKILNIFNKNIKHLLKQETVDSVSNAGFDGGIFYYNKKENLVKFSGAETPLFYLVDGEIKTIKGSRHSIGYKKSDPNFEFKEHTIQVTKGMQFYLTTDGFIDQNGGEKGFPFGKTKFKNIIIQNYQKDMKTQKDNFIQELQNYQKEYTRNDDITLIGVRL